MAGLVTRPSLSKIRRFDQDSRVKRPPRERAQ
jgi:hypothetical protein